MHNYILEKALFLMNEPVGHGGEDGLDGILGIAFSSIIFTNNERVDVIGTTPTYPYRAVWNTIHASTSIAGRGHGKVGMEELAGTTDHLLDNGLADDVKLSYVVGVDAQEAYLQFILITYDATLEIIGGA